MDRFAQIALPIVALASILGMLGGLVIDPLGQWIWRGHAERQPVWFTAASTVVFLAILLLEWHEGRENERIDRLIDALKRRREGDGEDWE
jgi:uncharacterized membrane protein